MLSKKPRTNLNNGSKVHGTKVHGTKVSQTHSCHKIKITKVTLIVAKLWTCTSHDQLSSSQLKYILLGIKNSTNQNSVKPVK